MSITATVENGVIKLPPGVGWPDGTRVNIEAVRQTEGEQPGELETDEGKTKPTLAETLAPFIGIMKDGPPDLAINHDHYLYGSPKQEPR